MAIQKTLTVNGKRYTGQQIASQFSEARMTKGEDYILSLNGDRFFGNYRQIQDEMYAPVCDRDDANAVSLMPDNGLFSWSVWLAL